MRTKHNVLRILRHDVPERAKQAKAPLKETTMSTATLTPATHVLSQRIVLGRVPVSRTTLWRMEREGRFPKRIKLSANRVGWIAEEVEQWIQSRKEA